MATYMFICNVGDVGVVGEMARQRLTEPRTQEPSSSTYSPVSALNLDTPARASKKGNPEGCWRSTGVLVSVWRCSDQHTTARSGRGTSTVALVNAKRIMWIVPTV